MTDAPDPDPQPKPRRGRAARLGRFLLGLVLLAGIAAGGLFLWGQRHLDGPGPLASETVVVVPPGMGVQAIGTLLEEAGVVADARLFALAARLLEKHRALKAGEYRFQAGQSLRAVLAKLEAHDVVARFLTVPEGVTSREIAALLDAAEGLEGTLAAIPPEGSVLPETYAYERGETRAALLARMRAAMDETLAALWAARAPGLPLATPREAVILASIVEKETGVDGERAKVAGVFVNRLEIGMRLQSDPTVIYALTEGEAPLGRALTRADWRVEHPYNTYRNAGLPPGPIAHPGRAAIEAVLNPAETEALYFVADGTGGHAFARTLEEHNRNVARWRAIRDGAGGD